MLVSASPSSFLRVMYRYAPKVVSSPRYRHFSTLRFVPILQHVYSIPLFRLRSATSNGLSSHASLRPRAVIEQVEHGNSFTTGAVGSRLALCTAAWTGSRLT